jgi:endonuclease YncB( thermonuclease family)
MRRPTSRRRRDGLYTALFIVGVFGLWFYLGMPGLKPEEPVRGNATMRDGDTLDIGGETFRIVGVDALEMSQICVRGGATWQCGREAARALARHIRGKTVACVPQARDRFGRTLAKCDIDGADIAEWLVVNGWAFDSSRFGEGPYVDFELQAAESKRGAWAGEFTKPWDWRPDHPLPRKPPPLPPARPTN